MTEAFGFNCSVGYVATLCQKINDKAFDKMKLLNECVKEKAKMIIVDETFPKIKEAGATRLAVAIDEFGLIRSLKAIIDRKKDLYQFFQTVLESIKPLYFLSDYDKTYPKLVEEFDPDIILCKDFVHAIGTIHRDARTTINKITVKTRGNLTQVRKKEIKQLKKRLISKQLYRVLYRIQRGFWKENAQIGATYIEGGLEELKELAQRFPSLEGFYKKTAKFINKYIDTWAFQMELNYNQGLPTTSNSIESKNSLFKVYRNNSKCFDSK